MTEFIAVLSRWHWTSSAWLALVVFLLFDFLICRRQSRQWGFLAMACISYLLAFVSPIGVLANGYLFSAHIIQHLILLLIAPLFYVLSLPPELQLPMLFRGAVTVLRRQPQVAWLLGLGAMWFWHVPSLCHAAGQSAQIGMIRDASLLLAGVAFWWPILSPRSGDRLIPTASAIYLFSACAGCTLLGIYVTFTPVSVCPIFSRPVDRLGILSPLRQMGFTPAADQQLGGLLMWVPPCLLYGVVILNLIRVWYGATHADDKPQYTSLGNMSR